MTMTESQNKIDPLAPHGRDANGEPLAPHGLKADGTPKIDGRGRPPKDASPGAGRGARPQAPPRPSGTQAPKPKVASNVNAKRFEALSDTVDLLVCTPLAMLGQKKVEFKLDAVAVNTYKGPVVEAIVEAAEQVPQVGNFLDKLSQVGPWSKLAQAILPMAAQIATNHNALPAVMQDSLEVIPKDVLIAEIERREEEMRQAAENAVRATA